MLIAALLPLLSHYKLRIDLDADGASASHIDPLDPATPITVTVIPARRAAGAGSHGDTAPLMLNGTVAEIDAALAAGADGPLGQLVAARVGLAEAVAAQIAAAEESRKAATAKSGKNGTARTAKPGTTKPGSARQPDPILDADDDGNGDFADNDDNNDSADSADNAATAAAPSAAPAAGAVPEGLSLW